MSTPYWDLTDDQRSALGPDQIGDDEYYVLWKINRGRHLLEWFPDDRNLWPTQMVDRHPRVEDCIYYDQMASLLMAAIYDGFDPRTILAAALDQAEFLYADGLRDPARLQRDL
jgi:hypothetical protein